MEPGAETIILVLSATVFAIVAVSGRLARLSITEPLMAVGIGILITFLVVDPIDIRSPAALTFLELTLALVLFTDAARIDVGRIRRQYRWPARMLLIGLPLAMVLGAVVAGWILAIPFGAALLLGVILAPTDAALAEPVLESEVLPVRVRQTLNIESGLNDGLALPVLFIAIGLIESEAGRSVSSSVLLVVSLVGIGVAGGALLGLAGAWVISRATEHGWMDELHQKIAAVALALGTFAAVEVLGGSGFVAAFVAGAVLGARVRPKCEYLYDFADTEGRALVLIAFVFLGAGPIYQLIREGVPWQAWVVSLVALFVVRPLAIAVSLIGEKLLLSTVLFFGWFGPRGLATAVFLLVAFEEMTDISPLVADITFLTVALSVLLHGVSAMPASQWLAGRLEMRDRREMPEMGEAFNHPTR
ncbi:MAG: sodium:proton antiporter [Acidobacteria bacterium]|nr:MAG: sodium:proton antiporter [Acidobacteriota bacterium]